MIEVQELDQDSVRRLIQARAVNGMIILSSPSLRAALATQTDIYAGRGRQWRIRMRYVQL